MLPNYDSLSNHMYKANKILCSMDLEYKKCIFVILVHIIQKRDCLPIL